MNLAFALTRTRVRDAMKVRGYASAGCHSDGNVLNPESAVGSSVLSVATVKGALSEQGKLSPWTI
jgi:hypothetical protein